MNDTKLDLEDLGGNIKNAQEQLKSYYEDLLGKVESVESQITDMLKKEIEKRKQAMQEEYDKKLELLQKAKDAYNRQNEEDDYQSEYDKEKQVNNASYV